MRAPLTEFELCESKAPRSESYEAPCETAERTSFSGDQSPWLHPSLPADGGSTHGGGKESSMWRLVLPS